MLKPVLLTAFLAISAPVWAQNAVKVRVLDATNAPVVGASVETQIWLERQKQFPTQITDQNGVVTLDLPSDASGKRVGGGVSVTAPGWAFGYAPITGESVEVRLGRGATLRGQVTDEAGKPIAGAEVRVSGAMNPQDRSRTRVFGAKNSARYSVSTQANGQFEMADVPTELNLDFQIKHPKFALKDGYQRPASDLALVKLAPGGGLRGRVLDLAGQPLPKIQVFASRADDPFGANDAISDANGDFQIESLAPGSYNLAAFDAPKTAFVLPHVTGVTVEIGQIAPAPVMRAVRGVEIGGIVRDEATGKPLSAATVVAREKGDRVDSGVTDAAGRFTLRVAPGRYDVSVSGVPTGYLRPTAEKLVEATEKTSVVTFDLKKKLTLRGVFVDEAGKPIQTKIRVDSGFSPEELFLESDAAGRWEWKAETYNDRQALRIGGGDAADGYYETLAPLNIAPGTGGEIRIVLRKKSWLEMPGRALTLDGQPLAGATIEVLYYTPMGEGQGPLQTSKRTATTNANGDFVVPRVRDSFINENFFNVKGQKEGFAFQKGGDLSKNGPMWQLSPLVFAALDGKIEGVTAPGARVLAGGREIVTGADGKFAFEGLLRGTKDVFAFKDGLFGSGNGAMPTRIDLKPQALQARDEELARDIWNDIARDATQGTGRTYWRLDRVQRLSQGAKPFAESAKVAQGDMEILRLVEDWNGQGAADAEALAGALSRIKDADMRLYGFLGAAAKSNDAKLAARALEEAKTTLAAPEREVWWREINFYRAAALAAKIEGEAAGFALLDRAVAFTIKNHPAKSTRTRGMEPQSGQGEMMALGAQMVAAGGSALLERLLDQIESGDGWDAVALGNAIPILAKTDLPGALLWLDKLQKIPEPTPQEGEENRSARQSPEYVFAQTATKLVQLVGQKSPEQALKLARRVSNGTERGGMRFSSELPQQALASAAPFQSAEIAAQLWRELGRVPHLDSAPRFAARAFNFDPQIGREQLETARKGVEEQVKNGFPRAEKWAVFCFYFARADAAQARFLIEREWGLAVQQKSATEGLGALAFAMSAVDAERAWQMARAIPADDRFTSLETRRKIGLFLSAPAAARRDFPFIDGDYQEWQEIEGR